MALDAGAGAEGYHGDFVFSACSRDEGDLFCGFWHYYGDGLCGGIGCGCLGVVVSFQLVGVHANGIFAEGGLDFFGGLRDNQCCEVKIMEVG